MKSGKLSQEHREQRNYGVQIWKQNLKQLSFQWEVPTCFLEENGGYHTESSHWNRSQQGACGLRSCSHGFLCHPTPNTSL